MRAGTAWIAGTALAAPAMFTGGWTLPGRTPIYHQAPAVACSVTRETANQWWLRFTIVNRSGKTLDVPAVTATVFSRTHAKLGTRYVRLDAAIPARDTLVSTYDYAGRYADPSPAMCLAVRQ